MNQSQFLAIVWNLLKLAETCIIWNLLKAREKSRVHGTIGFGFASHWLKNWRESFKPIIKRKRSNRNHVITFYSHLKTALLCKTLREKDVQIWRADDNKPLTDVLLKACCPHEFFHSLGSL